MSTKIYEEALADAKHLREVAETNAKNAIIEAVTPKIREFIDQELMGSGSENKNTDEYSSAEDIISESIGLKPDKNIALDSSAIGSLAKMFGSSNHKEILGALSESINELSNEDADLVKSAFKKIDNLSSDEINNTVNNIQENSTMRSRKEKVYEVDLNLLKEQAEHMFEEEEEEVAPPKRSRRSRSKKEGSKKSDDREMMEVLRDLGLLNEDVLEIDLADLELPDDFQPTVRVVGDEDEEVDVELGAELDIDDEGEDLDLDVDVEEEEVLAETYEIDPLMLKQELRRVRRKIREAKDLTKVKGIKNDQSSSWGGKGNANAGQKNQFGGKGSGKGNAFGGGSEKGDVYKVKLNALAEQLKKEMRKNRNLNGRLDEYRSAVETLREQLTDLNLFNAKLLYVNKLFQNKSISQARRRSMVESIDSAKSLREVKLIYKTLTESGSTRSRKGNLKESVVRSVGSSSRVSGRSSANRATTEVDRWATLAGLK